MGISLHSVGYLTSLTFSTCLTYPSASIGPGVRQVLQTCVADPAPQAGDWGGGIGWWDGGWCLGGGGRGWERWGGGGVGGETHRGI